MRWLCCCFKGDAHKWWRIVREDDRSWSVVLDGDMHDISKLTWTQWPYEHEVVEL